MNDEIILVNKKDEVIGYGEKMQVHREKQLHRAFSIFIFDPHTRRMLLQRRARGKYHSGGLWTNACCSHPRRGETMETCLNARLEEELGIHTSFHIENPSETAFPAGDPDVIYRCGSFYYQACFGEITEHEIDHVFLFSPSHSFCFESDMPLNRFDPREAEELRWVPIDELRRWLKERPGDFTAWFRPAFSLADKVLCRQQRTDV